MRLKRPRSRTRRLRLRWTCRELSKTSTRTMKTEKDAKMLKRNEKRRNNRKCKKKCQWKTLHATFRGNGFGTRLKESFWPRKEKEARKGKERKRRSEEF